MGFPLPADKIVATERALGVAFPLAYLARLRTNNGGEVAIGDDVWHLFPFKDDADHKRLARSCNDVVRETAKLRDWTGFPAGAVAIATDGGGNALVLLPREDDPTRLGDAVYDWIYDTGEMTKLADGFDELE